MSNRDLIRIIWGNLKRMRARVTLTAIGVVIGTAAVLVLISLAAGLQRSATADLGSLGDLTQITVLPAGFGQAFGGPPPASRRESKVLNDRALAEIKRLSHVVAVTPQLRLSGPALVRLNRLVSSPTFIGMDQAQIGKLGWEATRGQLRLNRGTALAGAKVGETFTDVRRRGSLQVVGGSFGGGGVVIMEPGGDGQRSQVDLQGRGLIVTLTRFGEAGQRTTRNVRLRVVGVLEERGGEIDFSLILPLQDVEKMNAWVTGRRLNADREGYQSALVVVDSSEQVLEVQQRIQDMGFVVFSLQTTLQGINTFFIILQAILGGIGAIALLVAAFGIANTMTMAIYERTREIGIMKAIGATNRDVMRVFLGEAGAIGFIGGVMGVLIGFLVGRGINFFAIAYLSQSGGQPPAAIVHTSLWLAFFAIAFATAVGLVSGIYPAMRAAGLKPLVALRYE